MKSLVTTGVICTLFLTFSSSVIAFPIGLRMTKNKQKIIVDQTKEGPTGRGKYEYEISNTSITILDTSGFICAAMGNYGNQAAARAEALDRAQYSTENSVEVSYKVSMPQAGATCGFEYHLAGETSDVTVTNNGSTFSSAATAKTAGFAVFGLFGGYFNQDNSTSPFWKFHLRGIFKTYKITSYVADDVDETLISLPMEYSIGKAMSFSRFLNFQIYGMIGYDIINSIMNLLVPDSFPTSAFSYGFGGAYRIPIALPLTVNLDWRNSDPPLGERPFESEELNLSLAINF